MFASFPSFDVSLRMNGRLLFDIHHRKVDLGSGNVVEVVAEEVQRHCRDDLDDLGVVVSSDAQTLYVLV